MKKIFILCLFVLMTSTLCSCGSAEYSKDESYVDKTKSLVNTSVEYTRIWRENDERFDYTNIDSAKEYINILLSRLNSAVICNNFSFGKVKIRETIKK